MDFQVEVRGTPSEQLIRQKVKCCACEGSLKNSPHINLVSLMKVATWKFPVWGNLLIRVWGLAVAVLCDKCVKEKRTPKYAVEWNDDLSVVKYHPVESLKDVPKEIFKPLDMIEPGRHGTAG